MNDLLTDGTVTQWVGALRAGDIDAAQGLFKQYFERLRKLCEKELSNVRQAADGEDIAIQVLATFFRRLGDEQYPDLRDRQQLWSLLVDIATKKAFNERRRQFAEKRDARRNVAMSALEGAEGDDPKHEFADPKFPNALTASILSELINNIAQRLINTENGVRVLELKLAGELNSDISKRLNCSLRTVERTLGRIRRIATEDGEFPGAWPRKPREN